MRTHPFDRAWLRSTVFVLGVLAGPLAVGNAQPDILDPTTIPQFVDPLVIPPVMPPAAAPHTSISETAARAAPLPAPTPTPAGMVRYQIGVRQFRQQVLPAGFPQTTVWGYGNAAGPRPGQPGSTYNFPAFTVETRTDQRVQVRWINELVDARRRFLPHLLPVDQTLHWANPPGPRDMHGHDPTPYLGPVPIVTHVHGAHVPDISDGYPEAWYLPNASNIPAGYFRYGTHYRSVTPAPPGTAVFEYPNDQRATTLWYHDHALGITRQNVYAGMAGFWIVRDAIEDGLNLPGPAPRLGDPPGRRYYEIPIAIQDRSFKTSGEWFYPDSREFFDGFPGPYKPQSDVPPIWNPEFFGNSIVVNGRTWPYLEVEPRLYRFRLLNGCNSRFLVLKFDQPLPFNQIGNEGGLLPDQPIVLNELLVAPAERADVIVDFSGFSPGDTITLLNFGPDAPFGGLPIPPEEIADPLTTGRIMQFRIVPLTQQGRPGAIPAMLPPVAPLGAPAVTRDLTLNEEMSSLADIPVAALLGTAREGPLGWAAPTTETPRLGDTEVWRFINLTADAHPMHLHLVQFQVLSRQEIDAEGYAMAQEAWLGGQAPAPPDVADFLIGSPMPAESWEAGFKDTVIAYPGQVTRLVANFDLPGLYVWHCHILEHEDNEMMRPFEVVP